MLTLVLVFVSAKLHRSEFKLSLPTIVFLLSKVLLILFIIISNAICMHTELIESILHILFTYILPLFICNELLVLSINGPNSGWVHYTGGGVIMVIMLTMVMKEIVVVVVIDLTLFQLFHLQLSITHIIHYRNL